MTEKWPKITARRRTRISPWMGIIEREVEFARGAKPELYHAVDQRDYVAIVAQLPDGRIPIIRQYRPALESFTWELPAGLLDDGEDPAACCRRELMEETGFAALSVHPLGRYAPCSGRLSNWLHSFFVTIGPASENKRPEPGIELKLVTPAQLADLIQAGEFALQLHAGALLLAGMQGFISLEAFQRQRASASPARSRPRSSSRRSPR
jgi:8-oxo-dGTP pyrophosphatase MutT (NUDIX family)